MNNFSRKADRIAMALKGLYPRATKITVFNDDADELDCNINALEREIRVTSRYLNNLNNVRNSYIYEESPVLYVEFDF